MGVVSMATGLELTILCGFLRDRIVGLCQRVLLTWPLYRQKAQL